MSKNKNILIPKLRFPEFVGCGEWEEATIGNIAVPDSSNISLNKLNIKDNGYAVYGADGIVGYIDNYQQKEKYISIVKDGSGVGRLNLCESYSSILSTLTCLKSKNKEQFYLEWIYYLLSTVDFSAYIKGAGIPHIYFSDFKNKSIPIPPDIEAKEQQKIASCLSSLDGLIEVHSKKLELIKQHKKGLMQNLFPQEGEKVPKLRFKEFEKSGDWEEKKFSKYIKLYRGSSPRPINDFLTQSEKGVNWIKIGDTKNAEGFRINKIEQKITIEGAEQSRKVSKGELILANSMSYGSTYELGIDGYIYDGWFVLREYEEHYNKEFLLQLLNSDFVQSQYKKMAAGGIVKNISSDIVYDVLLSKPVVTNKQKGLQEQQKIASCLSSLDDLITAQTEKIEQLKQHKKGLMQGLFPKIDN